MRTLFYILFFIVHNLLIGQITFDSQNNLSLFHGDSEDYIISENSLQLNASEAGSSFLIHSFDSTNRLDLSIDFNLQFSPSASNKITYYIFNDSLRGDGFEISIGENGNEDALEFSIIHDFHAVTSYRGIDGNFAQGFLCNLEIEIGDSIKIYSTKNESERQEEISISNSVNTWVNTFCIAPTYTTTRRDKFSFDNLNIETKNPYLEIEAILPTYSKHDLWITELMIDPTPARQLAETEYIEIHNNTASPINLEGWEIEINDSRIVLPEISIRDYHVITSRTLGLSNETILTIPSLNNESFTIKLIDPFCTIISEMKYENNLKPSSKSSGGYSYELQWYNLESTILNWNYSNDFTGGTPGRVNSVTSDSSLTNRIFNIQNGHYQTWLGIDKLEQTDSTVVISTPLDEIELQLNEVLYRPNEYGSEFLEFVNMGNNGYTNDLWIEYNNSFFSIPDNIYIPSNSFVLLTDNYYGLDQFYEVPLNCVIIIIDDFPELITAAEIKLLKGSEQLWHTEYSNDDENKLIESSEGVSLERTNIYENIWTSGNHNYGGASPGAPNKAIDTEESIKISSDSWVIHQGTEGTIDIAFNNPNGKSILNLDLFSTDGKTKRQVLTDYHLAADDNLEINLSNQDLGFYILLFEIKDEDGELATFKKPIVITN